MKREELGDLLAFLAVCEERSFTRAAVRNLTISTKPYHSATRRADGHPIADQNHEKSSSYSA